MSVGRGLGAVLRLSSGLLALLTLVWIASAVATGSNSNHHLLNARAAHTATAQFDGSLLIAGGAGNRAANIEFFDPVSGKSTPGPLLFEARSGHSAIALADGRVMLAGGRNGGALLDSTEFYDTASGRLAPGSSLIHARAGHTATTLADGRVLLAGGDANGIAEIYDPRSDRFSEAGKLVMPRAGHSAVRLGNGQVLLVGGNDAAGATAEIFDPASGKSTAVHAGLKTARVQPTLKLLSDGKVQVYGGDAEITMEIYNPAGYFSSRGHLMRDSGMFKAVMYSPGQAALVTIPGSRGRRYAEEALGPGAKAFERSSHSTTELSSRSTMVVVGGFGTTGAALDTITELGSCGGTVTTDLTDYSPGQTVVMSGSGWAPGEQIILNLHRDTDDPPDTTLYATADENGEWINAEYVVQQYDLNVTFVLTASGDTGCTAQTTFTDSGTPPGVNFFTAGLPAGTVITVNFFRDSNGGGTDPLVNGCPATAGVVSVTAPGPGSRNANEPLSKFCYSYPSTVVAGAVTYSLTSTSPPSPLTLSDAGGVDTSVTGTYGPACTAPTVSTSPADATITYGADATFTALLTGSGSITTQWQVDGGSGFSNIGSTETSISLTRTLTLTAPQVSDSGKHYRLRVVNPCGGTDIFSGSALLTVSKADATINVTPYHVTYDASSHTATGTATGVGSVDLIADLDLTGTTHTDAATYSSDTWKFHDPAGNYKDATATITDIIDQATATINVTPYHAIYDASPHTATGTATGVGSVNLIADLDLTGTTHTDAGTYSSDTWTFHDPSGNYKDAGATITDIIDQATATINVTPYHVTYDATAHMATGTATGVGGVNLAADFNFTNTTHTNAGTYSSDTWTFHDPSGNYKDAGATITDIIDKATAAIVVVPYNVIYDTLPHTAMGSATGVLGEVLAGLNLSGTTHTNAGVYTDSWTFTDVTGNYYNASGSITDTIGARPALVNYIGQTTFVTSGSSSTTAQVTLSASVQDPTGTALVGAKMDFYWYDPGTGAIVKALATGITVSQVPNSAGNTGTANAVVTLSTGQYGAESYLILVKMTGNYTNAAQAEEDKTATVVVAKPATTNQTTGAGNLAPLPAAAGGFAGNGVDPAAFTIGLSYNKSGSNLQGKVTLTVPQTNGVLYVRSNSLSSMAVKTDTKTNITTATIYTKASAYEALSNGTSITIDGNVTLRVDVVEGATPSQSLIGFTLLSTKDSALYYSNQWVLDSSAWKTVVEQITGMVMVE